VRGWELQDTKELKRRLTELEKKVRENIDFLADSALDCPRHELFSIVTKGRLKGEKVSHSGRIVIAGTPALALLASLRACPAR
jgi:hypothetical protein